MHLLAMHVRQDLIITYLEAAIVLSAAQGFMPIFLDPLNALCVPKGPILYQTTHNVPLVLLDNLETPLECPNVILVLWDISRIILAL
jgi:hypothetical protein